MSNEIKYIPAIVRQIGIHKDKLDLLTDSDIKISIPRGFPLAGKLQYGDRISYRLNDKGEVVELLLQLYLGDSERS